MYPNKGIKVFRVCSPAAVSAFLIGEFNGWSTTATPMLRVGDHWEVSLDLPDAPDKCACFLMMPAVVSGDGPRYVGAVLTLKATTHERPARIQYDAQLN
jgi:Carbohydrate-binding module 48 (Isoamylase N-terminal domain)